MPSFWVLKLRTMQFKGSKILNTCWILQIYHVQELGMSSSLCLLNPAGKHKLNPTYEETCQQKAWHQGHVAESFHVCPTERAESELALCFYSLCHPRRCVVLARRGSMSDSRTWWLGFLDWFQLYSSSLGWYPTICLSHCLGQWKQPLRTQDFEAIYRFYIDEVI